ncbi:hypothetical protein J14TS5_46350 [Paenibacillus lautus]|uniref:hypothetical protein n=1 Tax=Paenibacillus lautus TaxID=1401 RepID=UPI001B1DB19E|nr:hypothetical protein [Paenibacillus lautus]GIO99549.1 hypothetical protein J14TS5_46350 [Paenibacillus lautus]
MTRESDLGKALNEIVDPAQSSVTFDRVWQLHSSRSKRFIRSKRKAWIPAGIAAIMILSLLLNPSVKASIKNLIETKIIKDSSEAVIVQGWVSSRKWDTATHYATLQDAEKAVGTKLPFPQKYLDSEAGAINRDFWVTTEEGSIVGYYYSLRTKDRMLSVTGNYLSETDPPFYVESTEAVVSETVDINGIPALLFSVKEFDGYKIYIENGGWKMVIDVSATGQESDNRNTREFTEEEAISIARSITW